MPRVPLLRFVRFGNLQILSRLLEFDLLWTLSHASASALDFLAPSQFVSSLRALTGRVAAWHGLSIKNTSSLNDTTT
jgi:hypothetical protein